MNILFSIFVSVLPIALFWYRIYQKFLNTPVVYSPPPKNPFSVTQYLDAMERAHLNILDQQKPVDQTIILWWGLDGLTLDEDWKLKWISRKKKAPVNQNISYQPCQSILYAYNHPILCLDMCQSTQATINALQMQNSAMQMQACQQTQRQQIIQSKMMQQVTACCAFPPLN